MTPADESPPAESPPIGPPHGTTPVPHVLRGYSLLADGERGVLVGPHGDFAWMCFPRWDSDAVFAALIGGRSNYTVVPSGRHVWGGYYEDGTLIWRSRWVTDKGGIVECREALAYPGDPHRAVILRRVIAVEGDANVDITLDPAAGFERAHLRDLRRGEDGDWRGRIGETWLRWSGAPDAEVTGDGHSGRRLHTVMTIRAGEHRDLVLELSDHAPRGDLGVSAAPGDAGALWSATEAAWHAAIPHLGATLAPRDTRQAYAVLRGLTGAGGGMVAAATTGLPERADLGRNFDYRYVWIRDQCYAGQAVAADGPHPLLDDAVRFISERVLADGPDLMPAYTVEGGAVPPEQSLALPGYPGGNAIIGNHVRHQFQLDAFGEVLLLLAAAGRHERLDSEHHRAITVIVAAIRQRWQEAEAGIWELDPKRWTQSRLICAAGLRAVAAAAATTSEAAEYSSLADAIVADAARDGLHPSGRWQRAPGDPRVDSALLLPALRGALPADDPRSIATFQSVRDELSQERFVYRFRHDERPLGTTEGAFLLCGFWMALAARQQGDDSGALRWFERNRAACGSPGLFSEEYDVDQRQLRGNLPQAFVHALMFEASTTLASS